MHLVPWKHSFSFFVLFHIFSNLMFCGSSHCNFKFLRISQLKSGKAHFTHIVLYAYVLYAYYYGPDYLQLCMLLLLWDSSHRHSILWGQLALHIWQSFLHMYLSQLCTNNWSEYQSISWCFHFESVRVSFASSYRYIKGNLVIRARVDKGGHATKNIYSWSSQIIYLNTQSQYVSVVKLLHK